MTLNEAIRHAEEVAESKKAESEIAEIQGCDKYALKCEECAKEHRQLVEWLKDYKRLKEQEPSGDLISRQAAIDAANKVIERDTSGNNDVVNAMIAWSAYIKSLPSVKPQPCEDAVSRQALKDILVARHAFYVKAYNGFNNLPQPEKARVDEITSLIAEVVNAPSVIPEQQMGHWIRGKYSDEDIRYNDYSYKCNKCGKVADFKENFCPNCGCRMVGDDNEQATD